MKQIKFQYKHQDRLSVNIYADAEAAQTILEIMTQEFYQEINLSSLLQGFVQYVVFKPFGFLLMSELQVIKSNPNFVYLPISVLIHLLFLAENMERLQEPYLVF